jgi:hypothetical protein
VKILMLLNTQTDKIGDPILGIIIPGSILLLSIFVTWALYKHFSKSDNKKK